MLDLIITCRRNPALDDVGFFDHLRHIHWPLLKRFPAVLAEVPDYVQNHALGDRASPPAPLPVATERNSVIELGLRADDFGPLMALPDYQAHVRPDEGRFNDLEQNIAVRSIARREFLFGDPGRCKRFDFIAARDGEAEETRQALAEQSRRLALDPWYTGHVDKQVDHWVEPADRAHGFGDGAFICVREVWARGFAALGAVAVASTPPKAHPSSFSVFATEFVMQRRGAPDAARGPDRPGRS